MQSLIDDAIEKAQCPVYITVNLDLAIDNYAYLQVNGDDWAINRWNAKPEIYIHEDLDLQAQLACLYHELGHLDCFLKQCKCFPDKPATEFHAHRFALKHIPDKEARLWLVNQIIFGIFGTKETKKRVMRCKIYQEVMENEKVN